MDIWRHGKYLDLWSFVHFLSGFILCGLFYWLELSLMWALILTTLLLVLWEIFEYVIKIIEPSWNVSVDIIAGLLGFFWAAYLYFLKAEFNIPSYLAIVGITFLMTLWGFLDYLKKGYR